MTPLTIWFLWEYPGQSYHRLQASTIDDDWVEHLAKMKNIVGVPPNWVAVYKGEQRISLSQLADPIKRK